jgi:sortase B
MTSTYNKRPRSRGKVYDSVKSRSPVKFIEWVEPGNVLFKLIAMLAGVVPFAGLSAFNWLSAGTSGKSMFELITSMNNWDSIFAYANIEARGGEFAIFQAALVISAIMLILSFALILASIAAVATDGRKPLAYIGFTLGVISPLIMIAVMGIMDYESAQRAIEPSLYSYLALLAAILCLIYCVKYPYAGPCRDRRNSIFTRMLTAFVPVRRDGAREGARKVVFTTALITFIYFGATLGVDLFNEWRAGIIQARHIAAKNERLPEDHPIREIFVNAPKEPLEEYLYLLDRNNDMVGYIKIGDTKVNYPVLQTEEKCINGNVGQYYLDFDFYHNRSRGGAIFADHRHDFSAGELSDNTILYGHNIATGNYFAALSNYHSNTVGGDLSFYKKNPTIRFDTMFDHIEWKVFAVVLFNTQPAYGEIIEYWNELDFVDEDHFHDYIFTVMDRSVLFTDVDIEYGDQLLTLSTCYWPMGQNVDTRCVVFARRVRDGESAYVDVEKASFNRNVLRFTREANSYGQGWIGERVWDYKRYLLSY